MLNRLYAILKSLSLYIIGVIVTLVIVNFIAWHVGGETRLKRVELFSTGFLLGMLAMYIAVHVNRLK